jgi:hypothetical protein
MRMSGFLGFAALALASIERPAEAAVPSAALGYDYSRGPAGQETHSVLGIAGVSLGAGDVLGGVMRFDDSVVGPGYGLVLGGGASPGGSTSLRVLASRFVADESYRAWRLKSGPVVNLAGGTLGLSWVHEANNLGPDTDSGLGELAIPLASQWTGKLTGSYGRSGDVNGFAASAGAAWTIVPHLEVGGELGVARNAPSTTPGPRGGGLGLLDPLLGGGQAPEPSDEVGATTSLSVRATFP